MKIKRLLIILLFFICTNSFSQDSSNGLEGVSTLTTPDIFATMAIGFNYDYLRSPLRVDYERAKGLFGINIPFAFKPSAEMTGQLLSGVSDNFTDGEYFAPSVAVKQFANTTLQVDVPFFGGVLEWSHMRMFNVKYEDQITLSNFRYNPDTIPGAEEMQGVDISMLLAGNMSVPVSFDIGWETMTFGYAYKINDIFSVALNMHRHYFYFSALGNVDIDMAGRINVATEQEGITVNEEIDPDYSLHNQITGFYDLKRWTPTVATSIWRFQVIARFGFRSYADGSLYGAYSVPFFIDPETFKPDSMDADYIMDNLSKFQNSDTTMVQFNTTNQMLWELPSGFTIGFDIIPSKLNISYTKFAGTLKMELYDDNFQKEGDDSTQILDTLDFRFGATIDHMILLQGYFPWIYFKAGIFSFDASFAGNDHLVSNIPHMIKYGNGVLIPVLSGGLLLGDKMQFKGEINLTPFPAINTGIIYHF